MKKKSIIVLGAIAVILVGTFILANIFRDNIYKLYPEDTFSIPKEVNEKQVTLKKGDYVLFGNYNDQPILWRALDTGRENVLLQTEKVVFFMQFNNPDLTSDREDYRRFGSADWENSYLKSYLNSTDGFLGEFNKAEQELISDEIFVLTNSQVDKYLSGAERKKSATTAATISSKSKFLNLPNQSVWWWTASKPSSNDTSEGAVTSHGEFYMSVTTDENVGVCPAIRMNLKQTVLGGDGTKENPYYISIKDVQK